MEPVAYLNALRQRWWLPVVATVLAAAVAWLSAPSQAEIEAGPRDRTYRATHTLYRDSNDRGQSTNLNLVELQVTTGEVPERAAERVGYDGTGQEFLGEVTVEVDAELGTLRVSTSQPDQEAAARYVNGYAEVILDYLEDAGDEERQRELERLIERRDEQEAQIRELDEQIAARGGQDAGAEAGLLAARRDAQQSSYRDTLRRIEELEGAEVQGAGLTSVQEGVAVPDVASGPLQAPSSPSGRIGAASAVGLLAGLVLVLVADRLDTRLRTRVAVERAFDLPVLAEIPRTLSGDVARTVRERPGGKSAEAFRMVRAAVQLAERPARAAGEQPGPFDTPGADTGESVRTVLVTSAEHAAGRTTTVANLAAAFAESGYEVLCVDAEPGSDALSRALREHPGATEPPSADDAPGEERYTGRLSETGLPGVSLLHLDVDPRGVSWLSRPDRRLVRRLAGQADIVLFDAGPCLETNEPALLMNAVDAVVVVARSGRTTVDRATQTVELVQRARAHAIGVVLNRMPQRLLSLSTRPRGPAAVAGETRTLRALEAGELPPDAGESHKPDEPDEPDEPAPVGSEPSAGSPPAARNGARSPVPASGLAKVSLSPWTSDVAAAAALDRYRLVTWRPAPEPPVNGNGNGNGNGAPGHATVPHPPSEQDPR